MSGKILIVMLGQMVERLTSAWKARLADFLDQTYMLAPSNGATFDCPSGFCPA